MRNGRRLPRRWSDGWKQGDSRIDARGIEPEETPTAEVAEDECGMGMKPWVWKGRPRFQNGEYDDK